MSDADYLRKTNPNLLVVLHYMSKALWVILSAFFGYIGLRLYSMGIATPSTAELTLGGVDLTLEDAGPGLVVMVLCLVCALVGACRAKVEMTAGAISIATSPELTEAELPKTLRSLEHAWGLTEIAMIRMPVAAWASDDERAAIQSIQQEEPESWPDRLSEVARTSLGFRTLLHKLQSKKLDQLGFPLDEDVHQLLSGADFSLPWCGRLRWGRGTGNVDLFVCATGSAGNVKWYTFGE